MSREDIKLSIKRVMTDRPFLLLLAAVIVSGVVYTAITGFSLQVRDAQVYSRVSAFGEQHFYKDHWQYLAGFALFGAAATVIHSMLMIKLHNLERRQTALLLGYATIVIFVISLGYALSIMRLAFR
ncbi:hypothetical protein IPF89_05215 [Candidatus Saccharibacteria bacterium]|nr:MAG: hypothetical protein IPF89_05215 [Candidatus Saccharibacteria bacterium]